jgi:hypothetical protein
MQIQNPQTLYHKQKLMAVSPRLSPKGLPEEKTGFRLMVIYESAPAELSASLKDMLDKLITACRFKPEEVCYVNHKLNPVSIGNITSNHQPEALLIFGEIPLSRNLASLKKNCSYEINAMKVLRTEPLEKLEQIKAEKGALWSALQQMLNLK